MQECNLKLTLIAKLLSIKSQNEGLKRFKEVLYGDFLEFTNVEDALSNEAEAFLKLQELEKELKLIAAYPKLYTKNVIAVGGGFSAGKSEFISSFIKNNIKLPIGVVPTTAIPTYVFDEEKDVLLGCSKEGGVVDLESIDKEFYKKLSHNFIEAFEFNLKEIMPYLIIGSKMDYKNICFVDTPGYNPADTKGFTGEDIKTAKEFLEEANAFIWLIGADASGTIPASDIEFLSDLDLKNKKLYIVYNKADLRTLDDIEEVLDIIEETLQDEDIPFEGISAYSSILKKEFLYKGKSLSRFLKENDIASNKQDEVYQKLRDIYLTYKSAIKKQQKEKEKIFKTLHSISLDVLENIDEDSIIEKIDKLKSLFSTKKEEENLIKLKNVFEKFKESVDEIFGEESNFYKGLNIFW